MIERFSIRHKKTPTNTAQYSKNFKLGLAIFFLSILLIWDLQPTVALKRENIYDRHYLPSDILTESPRLLTVTKVISQRRTTSTVIPWPSHKFLRSVLSRSDNVILNTKQIKNRSKSTRRKSQPHGTATVPSSLGFGNSTDKFGEAVQNSKNSNKSYYKDSLSNYRRKKKRSGSKEVSISSHKSTKITPRVNESGQGNEKLANEILRPVTFSENDKLHSATLKRRLKGMATTTNQNSTRISSQRRFPHPLVMPLDENQGKERKTKASLFENTLFPRKTIKNVTSLPSKNSPRNPNFHANLTREGSSPSHEYSQINSPQIGFQYEILVPSSSPLVTSAPDPSVVAISTTLHIPSNNVNSSENVIINKTSSISTTPTVTVSNGGEQVNDENATRTALTSHPPPSSSSTSSSSSRVEMKGSKDSDTTTATTKLPNFHYNKSTEVISPNLQYPQPTPTQNSKLNTYFNNKVNRNRSSIGFSSGITFPPTTPSNLRKNRNKTLENAKRKDVSLINHNVGNVHRIKTTPASGTVTYLRNSHPNFMDDLKQNSSYVNTFFESTTSTHGNSWKYQPTQISYIQRNPPGGYSTLQRNPFSMKGSTSNHVAHQGYSSIKFLNHGSILKPSPNRYNNNEVFPGSFHKKMGLPVVKNETTLIHRKNMFTVFNRAEANPTIHVEGRNVTKMKAVNVNQSHLENPVVTALGFFPEKNFYDRTNNQLERPSISTGIFAGPDRSALSTTESSLKTNLNTVKDNDYFDQDDAQANLHHWIESEQGQSVSYSTELPQFTNLTWPYYITGSGTNNDTAITGESGGSKLGLGISSSASTGLAVSFSNTVGNEKVEDFDSHFEFYIPSAAANPHRNPILVKKHNNGTTGANFEFVSAKPAIPSSSSVSHQISQGFQTDQQNEAIYSMNRLKQNQHKGKIKQTHWGSKGVNIKQPQKSVTAKPHFDSQLGQNNIKVYESSTGNPKSSTILYPTISSHKTPLKPYPTSPAIFSGSENKKNQNHFATFTSPSSTYMKKGNSPGGGGGGSTSSWAFGSNDHGGKTEIASFVTSKTPTNIWYKPIINHFTASVPYNKTSTLEEVHEEKNTLNSGITFDGNDDTANVPGWGTKQPTTTNWNGYVGDNTPPDKSNYNRNQNVFQGNGPGGSATDHRTNGSVVKGPILFNVWNVADGKLKLESQREIPAWALNGYLLPENGTILNLKQIPAPLQPFVTNAINKETEVNNEDLSYVWQKLPIFGSLDPLPVTKRISLQAATTIASNIAKTKLTTTTTPTSTIKQDESFPADTLFENENTQVEVPSSGDVGMGWNDEDKGVMHSQRPISINYVLWNNPSSIYGQSIILSTPTPQQFLLSPQPTPVSYFPSSTITPLEESIRPAIFPTMAMPAVTIKNPESSLSNNSNYLAGTTTSIVNQEKLELLFQKYFQYFITTTTETPATVSTTTRLPIPLVLTNKVYGNGEGLAGSSSNDKAWNDLKKLILRLASKKSHNNLEKDSFKLDKEKAEDLEFLGNVASIAVIMSYIRNQYETALNSSQQNQKPSQTLPLDDIPNFTTTTSEPYGITDDMEPPHKDQLWATVYPLFQHYLNNPNFKLRHPPSIPSKKQTSLSDISLTSTSTLFSMPPTSLEPIPFTEPPTQGTTGNSDYYTRYNHYISYPTSGARSSTAKPLTDIIITEIPRHGATTQVASENKLGEVDESPVDIQKEKLKTLLLIKKLKKKKKRLDKKKKKKKKKLAAALLGGSVLKKVLHVVKKPSKYWLDLKFDIDFYDIMKKKLIYFIAYRYMPVALVLAFGLIPLGLSLVPLLYKMYWMKWKKPKYIKVPVPFPSPYPVPVYKSPTPPPSPPYRYHDNNDYNNEHHSNIHGHFPPDERQRNRPDFEYGHGDNDNNDPDIIHIDSAIPHQHLPPHIPPPLVVDHHYAADTSGRQSREYSSEEHGEHSMHQGESGDNVGGIVNSFNYDYVKHSTPTRLKRPYNKYRHNHNRNREDEHEVHLHLHDEESSLHPQQILPEDATHSPPLVQYTSYHKKDLQPYPASKPWEIGFDVGQTMAEMTNKHDMEILKILVENKKEKINKLLDMWKLAKYGIGVASDAAKYGLGVATEAASTAAVAANTVLGGIVGATTPLYSDISGKRKRKRKRKRRRKKRKHSVEIGSSLPSTKELGEERKVK